jgi:uncharacterized repeat protein (TIGR01451 family)
VSDLALAKTAAPGTVSVGATLTYTLTVTNNGPDTATGVTVADALPGQTAFVSVATTQGNCSGGAAVNCTIGTISLGSSAMITVVVRPTAPGVLVNDAVASGNEPDPRPENNRAAVQTRVVGVLMPPTARCSTVTATPRTLTVSRRTTIVARVRNNGRAVRNAPVLVTGPGIRRTARTNAAGIARITIQPRRTGIVQIRMTNQPQRCGNYRVGIVGVFRPPVTG